MGHNLLKFPNVQEMFKLASEILGYDLLKLCLEGPKSELDKTRHSQAAVLVTSLAAVEKLKDERPLAVENCVATAGFSVGEFTALTFAGALSFEEAVRLVKIRGEAMQAASELTPSGMMTVFYRPDAKINFACHAAEEWCIRKGLQDPVCKVANFLFPHCKVIAGNEEALKFIEMNAEDFGIRRIKHLAVSGAFHTNLMKPAQLVLKEALKQCKINPPLISVHSNVDGKHYRNADIICKNLSKQLCSPVKWEQIMHIIYERPSTTSFPRTFECGPGQSLRTILKMVNAKAWDTSFLVGV
ncbi:probable malonyl-CoA-acyl carrier protein transacylase, mitochondrial isoform X1 [Limulus polyphemus]|uniref:Probable malonyl-CoA-acyl carrier protein transacylase, mitochondrial isoform X1 n=1 Tax=Limulus polyphemus TaxID=6850 RepID=A0ABM1B531_LIMPO|nr:probable malonyl-CoA-acyl carrier protein transacylase, mitochondrial isoform X1 [Limulus polyphemus]